MQGPKESSLMMYRLSKIIFFSRWTLEKKKVSHFAIRRFRPKMTRNDFAYDFASSFTSGNLWFAIISILAGAQQQGWVWWVPSRASSFQGIHQKWYLCWFNMIHISYISYAKNLQRIFFHVFFFFKNSNRTFFIETFWRLNLSCSFNRGVGMYLPVKHFQWGKPSRNGEVENEGSKKNTTNLLIFVLW